MPRRLPLAAALMAAALSASAVSTGALAQIPVPDPAKVDIKVAKLADDFHTLEGVGGTISVLSGPDGVLLVDSQFAPLTDKLVAALRTFTDKPIRFLVDTHVHPDHVGGNENFARQGATIFAREALRERMLRPNPAPDGTPAKPAAPMALPVVTYDSSTAIHLDGEEVLLVPVTRAHTDGDTVVVFPQHDIVAVGDIFRSVGYPFVDVSSGGTLAGELEALSEVADRAGPATRIIPGHGPMVGREALLAQRDMIIAMRAKVLALVKQGKTLDEVIAAKPTAQWDAKVPQGPQTAERFVRWVYAEVSAQR